MTEQPTPEDLSRSLAADLSFIDAFKDEVTHDHWYLQIGERAVVGWPAALRRALAAEARVAELEASKVAIDTWGLELMTALGRFLREVVESGHPRTTQIRASFGDEDLAVLHLWATLDETDPAARCRSLAAARDVALARAAALERELAGLRGDVARMDRAEGRGKRRRTAIEAVDG